MTCAVFAEQESIQVQLLALADANTPSSTFSIRPAMESWKKSSRDSTKSVKIHPWGICDMLSKPLSARDTRNATTPSKPLSAAIYAARLETTLQIILNRANTSAISSLITTLTPAFRTAQLK